MEFWSPEVLIFLPWKAEIRILNWREVKEQTIREEIEIEEREKMKREIWVESEHKE